MASRGSIAINSYAGGLVAGGVLLLAIGCKEVATQLLAPEIVARHYGLTERYAGPIAFCLSGTIVAALGIGLFRRQRWTRVFLLIVCSLILTAITSGALILFLAPRLAPLGELDAGIAREMRVTFARLYTIPALVSSLYIYLFSRASIREQFRVSHIGTTTHPLGVSVVSAYFIVSAILSLGSALRATGEFEIAGFKFSGTLALAATAVFAGLQLWIGIRLVSFQPGAHVWAIAWIVFWSVQTVITIAIPVLRHEVFAEGPQAEAYAGWLLIPWLALDVAIIGYLLKRRTLFRGELQAAQQD